MTVLSVNEHIEALQNIDFPIVSRDERCLGLFRKLIHQNYRTHGRDFPWRSTRNPYHILVSEFMLQQTQVERVIPKYHQFLETFPDLPSIACSDLRNVLALWVGLGYNRRALALHQTCQRILNECSAVIPDCPERLQAFPGIGPSTAGAIAAFAFNKPTVFIETNIRRVFLTFFFSTHDRVHDKEILPLIKLTLDHRDPRTWYYALMDFGAMLKGVGEDPNRRSSHYNRQSRFEGSDRQIRGLILKSVLQNHAVTENDLATSVTKDPQRTSRILNQLIKEGFLTRTGRFIGVPSGLDSDSYNDEHGAHRAKFSY